MGNVVVMEGVGCYRRTAMLALTAAVLLDEQVKWAVTNQAKAAAILESPWLEATQ